MCVPVRRKEQALPPNRTLTRVIMVENGKDAWAVVANMSI